MKKTERYKKIIFTASIVLALLVSLFWINSINAANSNDFGLNQVGQVVNLPTADIRVTVANIIRYALGFLGIIAVGICLYAGFLWMTSAGEAEKIEKAKRILIEGVIGLLIIVLAFAIVSFVVSKLLEATGTGTEPDKTCSTENSGEVNGCWVCQSSSWTYDSSIAGCGRTDDFWVTDIKPRENAVGPKDTVVRIYFNKQVNFDSIDLDDGDITISKIGEIDPTTKEVTTTYSSPLAVAGTIQFKSGDKTVVEFRPNDLCDAACSETSDKKCKKCFSPWGLYQVNVRQGSIQDAIKGKSNQCGVVIDHCTRKFKINDVMDEESPKVSITSLEPSQGRYVPENYAVEVRISAKDNYEISDVQLYIDDMNTPVATLTSEPYVYTWQTPDGLGLKHTLLAKASDTDDNPAGVSAEREAIVRAWHCFNNQKDTFSSSPEKNEFEIDCGGTECGACVGADCDAADKDTTTCKTPTNDVCWTNYCAPADCKCEGWPEIQTVEPGRAPKGNFVTIRGRFFGKTSGQVVFLGGAGEADDKIGIKPSQINNQCDDESCWTDTQVIVVLPDGAVSGPIKIITTENKEDATNDNHGSQLLDFDVCTTSNGNCYDYPGICKLNPAQGAADALFKIYGINFGTTQGSALVKFGGKYSAVINSWADTGKEAEARVPNIQSGRPTVTIERGDIKSNPFEFLVKSSPLANPIISDVQPKSGGFGQYVTITGQNFGRAGVVEFINKNDTSKKFPADLNFPQQCQDKIWNNNQVIVKVPDTGSALLGDYFIVISRSSDNASSAAADFIINTDTPTPGICLLKPDNGPEATPVYVFGDSMGSQNGSVNFWQATVTAPIISWSEVVKVQVPKNTKTGPVVLVSAQGKSSNPLNFSVGSCRADDDCTGKPTAGECDQDQELGVSPKTNCWVCNKSVATGNYYWEWSDTSCGVIDQCCPSGVCQTKGTCVGIGVLSSYAWAFSTGEIPRYPKVVEECNRDETCPEGANTPSPSPWTPRWDINRGFDLACPNSVITARFNMDMNPDDLEDVNNYNFEKCGYQTDVNGDGKDDHDPCVCSPTANCACINGGNTNCNQKINITADNLITFNDGFIVNFAGVGLQPDSWYRMALRKGDALPGTTGFHSATAQGGYQLLADYIWQFKTRVDSAKCKIGCPTVVPVSYTANRLAKLYLNWDNPAFPRNPVYHTAQASAENNPCNLIDTYDYQWSWKATEADGANTNKAALYQIPSNGCSDSRDNDNDGKKDYKAGCTVDSVDCDYKCVSSYDRSEEAGEQLVAYFGNLRHAEAIKPTGGNTYSCDCDIAPQCSDSLENDGDNKVDYPADTECDTPGDYSELLSGLQTRSDVIVVAQKGVITNSSEECQLYCKGLSNNTWSWYKTGGYQIAGDPVLIRAQELSSGKEGRANLFINLEDPKVIAKWPDCSQACVNSQVGAAFNVPMAENTLVDAKNVMLFSCGADLECKKENMSSVPIENIDPDLSIDYRYSESVDDGLYNSELTFYPRSTTPGDYNGGKLLPNTYYRVILGSPDNDPIQNIDGLKLIGLNYDNYAADNVPDSYSWIFSTKNDYNLCSVDHVSVTPNKAFLSAIPAYQSYFSQAFGRSDDCSPFGQKLNNSFYSWKWESEKPTVAQTIGYSVGCGNGIIDRGENCDDGVYPPVSGDGCSNKCLREGSSYSVFGLCGNGVVESWEQCDYGVKIGNPAWTENNCNSATCLLNTTSRPAGSCRDGVIQSWESCDYGPLITDYYTDQEDNHVYNNYEVNSCNANTCLNTGNTNQGLAVCGNGRLEGGEACDVVDEPNNNNTDGCADNCVSSGSVDGRSLCGDGQVGTGEECELCWNDDKSVFSVIRNGSCSANSLYGHGDIDSGTPSFAGKTKDPASAEAGCQRAGADKVSCVILNSSGGYKYDRNRIGNWWKSSCQNGIVDRGEECDLGSIVENYYGGQNNYEVNNCNPTNCLYNGSSEATPDLLNRKAYQLAQSVGEGRANITAFTGGVCTGDPKFTACIQTSDCPLNSVGNKYECDLSGTKKGSSDLTVVCGWTDEACALNNAGYGADASGCCRTRPVVYSSYPHGDNVCRNTSISVLFDSNHPMDFTTFNSKNISVSVDGCAVAVNSGANRWWHYLVNTYQRVKDWVIGVFSHQANAAEINECTVNYSVTGIEYVDNGVGSDGLTHSKMVINLSSPLPPNKTIKVKFASAVKDSLGVSVLRGANVYEWTFNTGEEICSLNYVRLSPTSKSFTQTDEVENFVASTFNANGQEIEMVPGFYSWNWSWSLTPEINNTSATLSAGVATYCSVTNKACNPEHGNADCVDPKYPSQVCGAPYNYPYVSRVTSQKTNGEGQLIATATITSDSIIDAGKTFAAQAGVVVFVCENPWPQVCSATIASGNLLACEKDDDCYTEVGHQYVGPCKFDAVSNFSDSDNTIVSQFKNPENYTNFRTYYCRDAGSAGFDDDLPALVYPPIFTQTPVLPAQKGLIRHILLPRDNFRRGGETGGSNDALIMSVEANPQHISAAQWFSDRFDASATAAKAVGGYSAVSKDSTYYINAANWSRSTNTMYTNIYILSQSQNSNVNTKNIFQQLLNNMKFNVNVDGQGVGTDLCRAGTGLVTKKPFVCSNNKKTSCVADTDCGADGKCEILGWCNNDNSKSCSTLDVGNTVDNECGDEAVLPKAFCDTNAFAEPISCSKDFDCYRCKDNTNVVCELDSDCPNVYSGACAKDVSGNAAYCDAPRAKLIRNTQRLADLHTMTSILNNYYQKNNKYPTLDAGSYVSGRSYSTWPSWQATLGNDLGSGLPVDPIDQFNGCYDANYNFNRQTCWDNKALLFSCPQNSYTYFYSSNNGGNEGRVLVHLEKPENGDINVYESDYEDQDYFDAVSDNCKNFSGYSINDSDQDGVPDFGDNCPYEKNGYVGSDCPTNAPQCCPFTDKKKCCAWYGTADEEKYCGQANTDGDNLGNSCDWICPVDGNNDSDNDFVCGGQDNCWSVYNPLQVDSDGDCQMIGKPYLLNPKCGDACDVDCWGTDPDDCKTKCNALANTWWTGFGGTANCCGDDTTDNKDYGCVVQKSCGNGVIDQRKDGVWEKCDDGDTNTANVCNNSCTWNCKDNSSQATITFTPEEKSLVTLQPNATMVNTTVNIPVCRTANKITMKVYQDAGAVGGSSVALVFVSDLSGSMNEILESPKTRLDVLKESLKTAISTLIDEGAGVEVGLVSYALTSGPDTPGFLPVQESQNTLNGVIDSYVAGVGGLRGSSTYQDLGLQEAQKMFNDYPKDSSGKDFDKKVVVFMTDGNFSGSHDAMAEATVLKNPNIGVDMFTVALTADLGLRAYMNGLSSSNCICGDNNCKNKVSGTSGGDGVVTCRTANDLLEECDLTRDSIYCKQETNELNWVSSGRNRAYSATTASQLQGLYETIAGAISDETVAVTFNGGPQLTFNNYQYNPVNNKYEGTLEITLDSTYCSSTMPTESSDEFKAYNISFQTPIVKPVVFSAGKLLFCPWKNGYYGESEIIKSTL
ncbi:MAG: Ig-like domain-containing protein [Patescibacteria group bacterium]